MSRTIRFFHHVFVSKELLGPPTKFTTLTNVPLHTPVKRPMTGYLTDGIVQYLKQ
jgi:hypothetical protein